MKAIMAAQDISFINKIMGLYQTFRMYRCNYFNNAAKEVSVHKELTHLYTLTTGRDVQGARVLDLGCGQRAHHAAMWLADGADISGIDFEVPTFSMGLNTFFKVWKDNGGERAVKSLVRHCMFDRKFFSELSSIYGKPLSPYFRELFPRLHVMSATNMEFSDDTFDYVYSLWAF